MILWIIRHGKAEHSSPSGADFDRPLHQRGERQARWLGVQLAARDDAPRRLIASRAVRARRTAELVAEALGAAVEFNDRLLVDEPAGGVIDLLSVAAQQEDAPRLAVVGHNPTCSILASALGARQIGLRTGQAAVIELSGPIEPGAGKVIDVLRMPEGS